MSRVRIPAAAILLVAMLPIGGPAAAQTITVPRSPAAMVAASVAEAAQRFAIPETWIRAVMRVESGGQPRIVSAAGAMGLMQVMPSTWAAMRAQLRLGGDPFDIHDNIIAGVAFLRMMRDRYGDAGMLPAYNAGPGRYDDYLAHRRPLPAETVAYVTALQPILGGSAAIPPAPDPFAWTRAGLFPSSPSAANANDDGSTAATPPNSVQGQPPAAETVAANTPPDRLFITISGRGQR